MSKKLFFLIAFSLSPTLFGHHNYRLQFDNSREVIMQGIVTNFEWKNPHLEIFFDVQNNKGEIENWILPTAAPRVAQNNGVHPDTLNIGDEITVSGWLARDGSNAMRARSMQLADGELVAEACAQEWVWEVKTNLCVLQLTTPSKLGTTITFS